MVRVNINKGALQEKYKDKPILVIIYECVLMFTKKSGKLQSIKFATECVDGGAIYVCVFA